MKKAFVLIIFLSLTTISYAQTKEPILNVRLSFLLFPFTPLLSVEVKTFNKITVQGETNFVHTHGVNLKWFPKHIMRDNYFFIGSAFVENALLRKDKKSTILPYVGAGYAHNFNNNWLIDGRLGIGRTLNADKNSIYPIAKIGVGRLF